MPVAYWKLPSVLVSKSPSELSPSQDVGLREDFEFPREEQGSVIDLGLSKAASMVYLRHEMLCFDVRAMKADMGC